MQFTFYYREGCSLCEAMADELAPFQQRYGFAVTSVDVDSDPALAARYGGSVPVLAWAERVLCRYYLDPDVLEPLFNGSLDVR